ncbi:lytic transglycosylase domain-containing protein [Lichenihabitans sp. Uapishka_5]|uniref:lytic transglycosylase domain-containing protein n=1 Tax=Lichenihabitans sp. Uapishka_5 TaxID=3037302 RepID=UPI0029E81CAE|nr:lytic transglycosylase domain-containing protein [Lichenihabitans sp. Uapishka_5]MDX7950757.1 lytic transglycosylase domain-containing protein [Lichenihabitans sp. Uapishka_5]
MKLSPRNMTLAMTLGVAGLAGLSLPARHWLNGKLPHSRVAHDLNTPAGHGATIAVAPQPIAPAPTAGPDGRFALAPAAQVAAPWASVALDGFVALAPQAAEHAEGFERASLAVPPRGGASAAPADFASAHQAIALYRKGNVAAGDEFAKPIADPQLRTAVEWVALKFDPREAGLTRLKAFAASHADWATLPWIRRRIEEMSVSTLHDPNAVVDWFGTAKPTTLFGRLALARAEIAQGDFLTGVAAVRAIWRVEDISTSEEADILREFGPVLGSADHKRRADRLLYKEQVQPALRAAALAGPDVKLLAMARAAVIAQGAPGPMQAAIAAVPKTLADDPGLLFNRIQKARRAGDVAAAASLMAKAPTDPSVLVNGDEWWVERRLVARKLLDNGDPRAAFQLCADHAASSDTSTIEAEFHAGWIALRFLDDPATAATHFAKAANVAETPISAARAAYWQGRAAEQAGDATAANRFYAAAANQSISFYGQLASSRLGRDTLALRQPADVAVADDRREAIRAVEHLYALGERDIALSLAFDVARSEPLDSQVAALAAILVKAGDARGTLLVGKYATQRGLALDESAFPTFGIPGYQPLTNSADRAVVYAIARQESEFDQRSASAAGAKGLMQLIGSTARMTATKLGVSYDDARLVNDAAFNAQIGAAHLGQLLAEQRGSYILTFAAYNAGSGRVKEWIDAYGDPRRPGVDPVDWIERIPFTETRNYVQRVFENMQVYRRLFGETDKLTAEADLAQRKS